MPTQPKDIANRETGRRLRLFVVLATPLIAAGTLFLLSGTSARAETAGDPGLAALAAPRLKMLNEGAADAGSPIVVAKRGRLLSNGTRVRSSDRSERSEEKPADTAGPSTAAPVRDITSEVMPTAAAKTPAVAVPAPSAAAAPPIVGTPSSGGMQCVANCPRPVTSGTTTPLTVVAGTQSSGAKPLSCIAGCNGLPTPIAARPAGSVGAPGASAQPSSDGATSSRITVLRGVTRTKIYGTGN